MRKIFIALMIFLFAFSLCWGETVPDDYYFNQTLGIKLKKPAGWVFASAAENAKNLENIRLEDPKFQELVIKYSTTPLVVLTKYQEPYPDLNPSFKMNTRPYGNLPTKDPLEILNMISPMMQRLFKDYKLIEGPKEVTISGIRSGYLKIYFTLQSQGGDSFPTCSELWIIPRENFFFMLGAGTRQDEKTGKLAEIREIINSIEIK